MTSALERVGLSLMEARRRPGAVSATTPGTDATRTRKCCAAALTLCHFRRVGG